MENTVKVDNFKMGNGQPEDVFEECVSEEWGRLNLGVYHRMLPWKYDHLLNGGFPLAGDLPRRLQNENQRAGRMWYDDGHMEDAVIQAEKERLGEDAGMVSGNACSKEQLALLVYFAFESAPLSGICRTSVRDLMEYLGYVPKQTNGVGIRHVKKLVSSVLDRDDRFDTIKVRPANSFETDMKFSTCVSFVVEGDGKCDPNYGRYLSIGRQDYYRMMNYALGRKNTNLPDMIAVYMYLKGVMKYVVPSGKRGKTASGQAPGGWGCWADPNDVAADLGITRNCLNNTLMCLVDSRVLHIRKNKVTRMYFFATRNLEIIWRDLERRIQQPPKNARVNYLEPWEV